jgi:hypothetical protein
VLSADKNESRATLSGSRLSFMRSAYIVAVWKQDSHMFQHIGFTVLVGTIYLLLNLLNISSNSSYVSNFGFFEFAIFTRCDISMTKPKKSSFSSF